MSFFIQQTEENDCGIAICAMIINQFKQNLSLTKLKIIHNYNHQQYSFEQMIDLLKKHQIKSEGYEFNSLNELDDLKGFICFQIINSYGLLHFILAKKISHNRWLIYDPASLSPLIWSEKQLSACITKKILIYQVDNDFRLKKKVNYEIFKFFYQLIKNNLFPIILLNLLLVFNLTSLAISNSFLRIVLQNFQFLTSKRLLLLIIGLICLLTISFAFSILIKKLNYIFINSYFQKNLESKVFDNLFFEASKYLFKKDLQKNYFDFQNNLINSLQFVYQIFGIIIFAILLSIYFYYHSKILFLSSIFLITILTISKYFKIKHLIKKNQLSISEQNWYFYQIEILFKNLDSISNKTSLKNYLSLKNLNHVFGLQQNSSNEFYNFIERFLIFLYYLLLTFLINWNNNSISSLIIFTSLTLVMTNYLEQLIHHSLQLKFNLYFNEVLFSKPKNEVDLILKNVTYKNKKISQNYLIVDAKNLKDIKINFQKLTNLTKFIYDANKSLNLNDNIYHNIFNYEKIDLDIIKNNDLITLINQNNLDLESNLTTANLEIVKYLSCYFAKQKIIILNYQKDKELMFKLSNAFKNKTFIFIKNEKNLK